jgi:hypothetical protein
MRFAVELFPRYAFREQGMYPSTGTPTHPSKAGGAGNPDPDAKGKE